MKKLLIGFLAIMSATAFSKTIEHSDCRLFTDNAGHELSQSLEKKGYVTYSSERPENNSLIFHLSTIANTLESHPLSVLCPGQSEKWAQFEYIAYIVDFDGAGHMVLASERSSYQACQQSGGDKKSERALKRILKSLPDCQIK